MSEYIRCLSTRGRFGSEISNAQIACALSPHGITPHIVTGVFWHQAMDSAFVRALNDGVEWIMTIDGDTICTADHVGVLLAEIKHIGNIDCLAALQARRGVNEPLAAWDFENVTPNGRLQPANQAHFGLTFLRTNLLAKMETPWFFAKPDENGHYIAESEETGHLDADIWFWRQWRAAGNKIWIDRECTIGHLDESVISFRNGSFVREGVREWLTQT